jgi:hypothetical protein
MGKTAIVLVVVMTFVLILINRTQNDGYLAVAQVQPEYEHQVIAREYAASGLEIALSTLRADFLGNRLGETSYAYRHGSYTISLSGPPNGPVDVTATGFINTARHHISAAARRPGLLDAITFEDEIGDLDFLDPASVSGTNLDPSGSPDMHAFRTTNLDSYDKVLAEITPGFASGVGGPDDVVLGQPDVDLDIVEAAIRAYSGPRLFEYPHNVMLDSTTPVSSIADPVVIRVSGSALLDKTFAGSGILFIDGGLLKMQKTASWDGLVFIVNSTAGGAYWNHVKDDVRITGAVVVRGGPGAGAINYRIRDNVKIQYSSEALYRAQDLLIDKLFGPPRLTVSNVRETSGYE